MNYRPLLPMLVLSAGASLALAVNTSTWTATTEADFAQGQMSSVVANNLGELKLSRQTRSLVAENPLLDLVHALCPAPDGSVYLGTGPRGAVLRYQNGQVKEICKAGESTLVTALAFDAKGQLLVGLSGASARLLRIDPATGKAQDLFKAEDLQFIWAIQPMPDGTILLGTGPTGRLLEIAADGRVRTVFQSKESNLLCILPGEGDDLLVGTDPEGLVLRVNRKTGDWFVAYDAEEPEIVALVRDPAGKVYAAASAPVEGTEGDAGAAGKAGRPEPGTELPLRREPPAAPEPPVLPDPSPGEPEPIPKAADPAKRMSILDSVPAGNKTPNPATQPATTSQSASQPRGAATAKEKTAEPSSAVYRLDAAGFVQEIFRRPVTLHSMLYADGSLILGAGPEGLVFQVNPDTQETLILARTDSRNVSVLAQASQGQILLGLSNPGGLSEMGSGHASRGTFTSPALDAQQIARFGKLQLQGTLAAGTAVTVATRSGNVRDPELGGWSKWSEEISAAEFLQIPSPAARFFQYRLTLSTQDARRTPSVEEVKVSYLIPNMPPKIEELSIEPKEAEAEGKAKPAAPQAYTIGWTVSEPNDDTLVYSLFYRLGHRGEWVLLKDKVKDSSFDWNTRQLADGRYQIKLVASDAPSNPPGDALAATRFSDPVYIDNTPPVIGDLKSQVKGREVQVSLRVIDRTSTVAGVEYAVDSSDDWQAASSSDMLYDSPDETVKFAVSNLVPGQHQVTVRARDSRGNTSYETLIVTIDQQEQKK